MEALTRINHPFYCVWCDTILPNRQAFDECYRKCLNAPTPYENLDNEQVFELVYEEEQY